MSSDLLLILVGQDIAEGDLKGFIFAISLLGATIQGGSSTRERSDVIILTSNLKSKNEK